MKFEMMVDEVSNANRSTSKYRSLILDNENKITEMQNELEKSITGDSEHLLQQPQQLSNKLQDKKSKIDIGFLYIWSTKIWMDK